MKRTFITSTMYLIYMLRFKTPICQAYERTTYPFPYELYLLGACAVLGIVFTENCTIPGVLWSMSIWLESVAIPPQLVSMQQGKR